MPLKTLVETSTFTELVQVPVPGDLVAGATSEVSAQALANRTRFHAAELTRIEALVGSQGVQNWELAVASIANLNAAPIIAWVPTDTGDAHGLWVAVAGHAANIAAVGLSEDECGMEDVSIAAGWPVGATSITWMAVAPWDAGLGCAPFVVGGAQDDIALQRGALPGAGSFTTTTLAGAAASTCGVWSVVQGVFIIGGDDGAAPVLWRASTADPPFISLPTITVDVSTTVLCMAGSVAGVIVAVGDTTGAAADTWVSTDGGNTFALYTIDLTEQPAAMAYSESLGLFMLVTNAAGDGYVYTSPDGTTWTRVATAVPDLGSAGSLVEVDGLWVAGCEGFVLFSQDAGATWRRCTLNGPAGTASPNVLTGLPLAVAYSPGRRRFAAVHKDAADALVMNRSLSIGLMPEHS